MVSTQDQILDRHRGTVVEEILDSYRPKSSFMNN